MEKHRCSSRAHHQGEAKDAQGRSTSTWRSAVDHSEATYARPSAQLCITRQPFFGVLGSFRALGRPYGKTVRSQRTVLDVYTCKAENRTVTTVPTPSSLAIVTPQLSPNVSLMR